ncbi:MAG TPA: ester cyclase [Candidatus Limnocylindria bacterium]
MAVDPISATKPADVVRRYLDEVLAGGESSALEELVSSDDLKRRVASFRRAFPDFAGAVRLLIAEGDLVAVHLTGRGTHRGLFQGVPPTGREWTAGCSALYRVEDGRIVDAWVNWDLLAILEQIGGVTRASTASA